MLQTAKDKMTVQTFSQTANPAEKRMALGFHFKQKQCNQNIDGETALPLFCDSIK